MSNSFRSQKGKYVFHDLSGGTFKASSHDFSLPLKFKSSISDDIYPNIRFSFDYILSLNDSTITIWRYNNFKRNIASGPQELFIPSQSKVSSADQALIIFDTTGDAKHAIFIDDNGLIRFWPTLNNSNEFIDQKINNIINDKCLMVNQILDDLIIAFFESKKIILCDLRDFSDIGIILKQFTQSESIIGGLTKRITSIFTSSSHNNILKNMKINTMLKDGIEILYLYENDLSSCKFDILHNGSFSQNVINLKLAKTLVTENLCSLSDSEAESTKFILINFDLQMNIIYLLMEVLDSDSNLINYVLMAYNRRMDVFESYSVVQLSLVGNAELRVIEEKDMEPDQLCLLVAIKDDNTIFIVEILTGIIKCEINVVADESSELKAISGWGMPNLTYDFTLKIALVSSDRSLISVRHSFNKFSNKSINRSMSQQLDQSDLSLSFNNQDTTAKNFINRNNHLYLTVPKNSQQGDVQESDIENSLRTKPYMGGDNVANDDSVSYIHKLEQDLSASTCSLSLINKFSQGDGTYGKVYKSLILHWMGYESQASRIIQPIIEEKKVNPDLAIAEIILNITREIINEYPVKDPRWKKFINENKFCFCNKSLLREQQLASKKEAVFKIMTFLINNKLNHHLTSMTPISVYQNLIVADNDFSSVNFGQIGAPWVFLTCIGVGGEFIEFVRVFIEIIDDTSQWGEIEKAFANVGRHLSLIHRRMGSLEIISQEVTLVPEFIRSCVNYIDEFKSNMSNCDTGFIGDNNLMEFKLICNTLARVFSMGLRSALNYRNKFFTLYQTEIMEAVNNLSGSVGMACWITEEQPVGVLDFILEIILNLLDFASSFQNSELFGWSYDIGVVLLEFFKTKIEFFKLTSNNGEEARKFYDRYMEVRYRIIEKIVKDDFSIEKGLEMAENFEDYFWITSICEMQDGASSELLEGYLEKFKSQGFSEFVLDWYQDKLKENIFRNRGSVMAKIQRILERIQNLENIVLPSSKKTRQTTGRKDHIDQVDTTKVDVIDRFLERDEVHATSWLHQLEIGQFAWAGRTLERLGLDENTILMRKKSLLSLSKLCLWANCEETIHNTCWGSLELIELQEKIPKEIIESELGYSKEQDIPPISVQQLVHLFMICLEKENDIKYAMYAIDLLNLAPAHYTVFNISHDEIEKLTNEVWIKLLFLDNWENKDGSHSIIFQVINEALNRGLPVENVLPDLNEMFESNEFDQFSDKPELLFNMKKEMEKIVTHLNLRLNNESVMI